MVGEMVCFLCEGPLYFLQKCWSDWTTRASGWTWSRELWPALLSAWRNSTALSCAWRQSTIDTGNSLCEIESRSDACCVFDV